MGRMSSISTPPTISSEATKRSSEGGYDLEARLEKPGPNHGEVGRQRRWVGISGLPLFCGEVVRYAREYLPQWEARLIIPTSRLDTVTAILRLASCDVWYTIGGPITNRWVYLASRLLRKPHVIHWVGSDITKLREPWILEAVQLSNTSHLAEVKWTAAELAALGIQAKIVPLPPHHCTAEIKPLPKRFTVLLYIPRTRAEFYGARELKKLMERLRGSDVRILDRGRRPVRSSRRNSRSEFGMAAKSSRCLRTQYRVDSLHATGRSINHGPRSADFRPARPMEPRVPLHPLCPPLQ